ncbi:MAG: hypothetical protein WAT39_13980 [Planctomycetota bacterium]
MTPVPAGVLALVASVGMVLAQEGQTVDPLELVARAERLVAESPEDAILLLWAALERLGRSAEPTSAAATTAALGLLQTHDPLHADRSAALIAQARAQVDLALLYRGKKWVLCAADCLDLADRFDATVSYKERAQLAKLPVGGEPSIREPRGHSLLRRAEVVRAEGPWREAGDTLECGYHPAKTPWYEWILDGRHEDCELSVEFRSSDRKAGFDCALLVGLDNGDFFYQCIAAYYPDEGHFDVRLYERKGEAAESLASSWVASLPGPGDFHRLTLRVHGKKLRVQLDATPAFEATAQVVPRGRFGLTVGVDNQDSAPITLRNFERRPWPPLTEAAQRAIAQEVIRKRIVEGIDGANALMTRKEPEAAARWLRVARRDAVNLDSGPLRTSLVKSIEDLLAKADLLHTRRQKVARDGVRAFVELADRYAAAGRVRAALRTVELAAWLDAEQCAVRLGLARQAVAAWRQQQGRCRRR